MKYIYITKLFIVFIVVSFGSKVFQEQCNDKKDFTRSEMAITVILPGIVLGFISYYFTNEYKNSQGNKFGLLQEPFESVLAE